MAIESTIVDLIWCPLVSQNVLRLLCFFLEIDQHSIGATLKPGKTQRTGSRVGTQHLSRKGVFLSKLTGTRIQTFGIIWQWETSEGLCSLLLLWYLHQVVWDIYMGGDLDSI